MEVKILMCSRKPEIMSDSAYVILSKDSKLFTGNFIIDEDLLRNEGITDFNQYAVSPGKPLLLDGFLPEEQYKKGDNIIEIEIIR